MLRGLPGFLDADHYSKMHPLFATVHRFFVYLCFFATLNPRKKLCGCVCVFHLHWSLGGVDASVALSKKTQSGGEKKRLTTWSDFFGFMLNISSLHCFSREMSDESSKYG